jgi:sulfur carrier protein
VFFGRHRGIRNGTERDKKGDTGSGPLRGGAAAQGGTRALGCGSGVVALECKSFHHFHSLGALSSVNVTVNGQLRQIPATATVADLLAEMQVSVRHVAVEVNLDIVPRSQHAQHSLSEGDRVEVVTLVGGG